ncbi:unnamed protein product [Sphagnum balticum]
MLHNSAHTFDDRQRLSATDVGGVVGVAAVPAGARTRRVRVWRVWVCWDTEAAIRRVTLLVGRTAIRTACPVIRHTPPAMWPDRRRSPPSQCQAATVVEGAAGAVVVVIITTEAAINNCRPHNKRPSPLWPSLQIRQKRIETIQTRRKRQGGISASWQEEQTRIRWRQLRWREHARQSTSQFNGRHRSEPVWFGAGIGRRYRAPSGRTSWRTWTARNAQTRPPLVARKETVVTVERQLVVGVRAATAGTETGLVRSNQIRPVGDFSTTGIPFSITSLIDPKTMQAADYYAAAGQVHQSVYPGGQPMSGAYAGGDYYGAHTLYSGGMNGGNAANL